MFDSPKLFLDSSSNEGSGTTEIKDAPVTTTTTETEVKTPTIPEDIQKELDELRAFKKTVAESGVTKSPEELQKEAEIEKAEFIKYSAQEGLMKVDDFSRYETLKQRQDRELVYDDFVKDFKDDNKEATDEEIKEAFESQYHLNSENAALKKRGEKIISKEAKELRTPLESSYNTAKERYSQAKTIKADYPNFDKFISSSIKTNIPEKFTVYEKDIEGEKIAIDIELTADEKKEIYDTVLKEIANPEVYNTWKKDTKDGKNERIEKLIAKETKYLINEKKQQVAIEQTATKFFEKGETIGTKKGSNIGAKQPFAIVKNMGASNQQEPTDAMTQVAKSDMELRQKINGRRAI